MKSSCVMNRVGAAAVAAAILGVVGNASGVVYKQFQPTGEGGYNDDNNWHLIDTVANTDVTTTHPTDSNDVRIGIANATSTGSTATIGIGEFADANFLDLGVSANTTGSLRSDGGSISPRFDLRIGGNSSSNVGGTGVVTQNGATATLTASNLFIGLGSAGNGTLNVNGGSVYLDNIATSGGNPVLAGFYVGSRTVAQAGLAASANALVNQTAGDVLVEDADAATAAASLVQLGRTGAATGNSRSGGPAAYNLSGGRLSTPNFQFGSANTGAPAGEGGTLTLNLSGTGQVTTNHLVVLNPTATSTVNFTGGTLTANDIGLPINNNGGTFSPGRGGPDLAAGKTENDFTGGNEVGTATFSGANTYTQSSTGKLRIDVASNASADKVVVGGAATIAGGLDLNAAGAATTDLSPINILNATGGLTGKFTTYTGNTITNSNGKSRALVPTYDANNVNLVPTLPGDANLDGKVTVGDLGILATNFNGTGKEFQQGDFNFDGSVTVGDLGILATFFNQDVAAGNLVVGDGPKTFSEAMAMPEFAALNAAVPEPASFSLLGIGAAGMLLRRRRSAR